MKCTDHIPDDKGDDEFFQRFGYYSSILGRPCQNEAVIFLQDDDGRNEYGQFDEALCCACAQRLIDRIRDDARLAKLASDVTLRLDQHRLRSAFTAELRSRLNNAVRLAALGDVGLYDAMDAMSQRAFGDFAITDKKGEHYIRHSWAELDERSKRVPEVLLCCVQKCREKHAQAFQRVFDLTLEEAQRRFERIDRYYFDNIIAR